MIIIHVIAHLLIIIPSSTIITYLVKKPNIKVVMSNILVIYNMPAKIAPNAMFIKPIDFMKHICFYYDLIHYEVNVCNNY